MSVDDFPDSDNSASPLMPAPIASAIGGVSLWLVELAVGEREFASIVEWLSPAEHARARRFGRDYLRRRYVIGRASLRMVLGQVLSVAPSAVPIVRGERGRPKLDRVDDVDFNISHTDEVALIGIARGKDRIGVDIERADRQVDADGLARKFLTPSEQATLAPLSADERRVRFLRYWTCKEAMSKATGDALSAPFRRVDVMLGERLTLAAGPAPYEPPFWRLHAAAVPDEYFGTVALWSGHATATSRSSVA